MKNVDSHPCKTGSGGVYYNREKRRKERDTMTNIFMKGDLDDMIFEGSDWQPSERYVIRLYQGRSHACAW